MKYWSDMAESKKHAKLKRAGIKNDILYDPIHVEL